MGFTKGFTNALLWLVPIGAFFVALVWYVFASPRPSDFLTTGAIEFGNAAPRFAVPYETRRICVDRVHDGIATSTLNRAGYLDGGEAVGVPVTATDPDGDPLAYYLGLEDENRNYMFFDYTTSTGQIWVSGAGATDRLGLDADQVYPVVATTADGRGGWHMVEVGVFLDSATRSPSSDGVCP